MTILILMLPGHSMAAEPDWVDYSGLLGEYVSSGEKNGIALTLVDYRGLGADKRWMSLLSRLAEFDEQQLVSPEEKLAFWINAYNILAIQVVLDHWPLDSIRDAGSFFSPVWKKPAAVVAGKMRTLHEIEHEILRPMGEPRIHFAIVCASVSCPDLKITPYDAMHVHGQLDAQAKLFIAQADKGVRIEADSIQISKIFDWFEGDFQLYGGVAAFIRDYRTDMPMGVHSFDYLDYDWSLNTLP